MAFLRSCLSKEEHNVEAVPGKVGFDPGGVLGEAYWKEVALGFANTAVKLVQLVVLN